MANWNGFRLFLFMASQGNSVSLGYIFRIYIIIFLFPLKSGVQEFQCYTLCCPLKYWSLWQFPLCKVTGHPNVTCCWHVVLVNSRLVHSPWLGSTGPHAHPAPPGFSWHRPPWVLPILPWLLNNRSSFLAWKPYAERMPCPQLFPISLLKRQRLFWEVGGQPLPPPLVACYLVAHIVYRLL